MKPGKDFLFIDLLLFCKLDLGLVDSDIEQVLQAIAVVLNILIELEVMHCCVVFIIIIIK